MKRSNLTSSKYSDFKVIKIVFFRSRRKFFYFWAFRVNSVSVYHVQCLSFNLFDSIFLESKFTWFIHFVHVLVYICNPSDVEKVPSYVVNDGKIFQFFSTSHRKTREEIMN